MSSSDSSIKTPLSNEVLEDMKISKALDGEVLSSLRAGRRTVGELTEKIYGVTRNHPEYRSYYMKVFRSVKALQQKGYVSTNFFGRDRPYRLTPFAAAKMMEIDKEEQKLFPPRELVIYSFTIGLGILNMLIAIYSDNWLSGLGTTIPYSLLLVLTGYCLTRLTDALRKVS